MLNFAFALTGMFGHLLAAALHGGLAIWMLQKQYLREPAHKAMIFALVMIAGWALVCSWEGPISLLANFMETVRNGALVLFMYTLLRSDESHGQPPTVSILYLVMGAILLLQAAVNGIAVGSGGITEQSGFLFFTSTILRMIFAVGALVLVHNLYSVASPQARIAIRLPISGLAVLWFFDLNLYTISYLANAPSSELLAMRGVIAVFLMPLFALAVRSRGALKVQLSRSMAFHSFSLVAIGFYLVVMVMAVQILSFFAGEYAALTQVSFIFGTSLAALMLLPSNRFRAWFKVKIAKHFFQHRYDYRAEWMRFADTIGRDEGGDISFHRRVIKAVADITDSKAGLLLTPENGGHMSLQEHWNWPAADVPAIAFEAEAASYFEGTGYITELDNLRQTSPQDDQDGADNIAPWLIDESRAWIVVPLIHYAQLVGLLVLGRPTINRSLDWEDLDMLRVAGRQAASYLAEERGQNALAEAQQFEEFNRRFAFVMHDIKNTVSQLSLMSRNAQKHIEKPEFRADMLDTLQGSVDKLSETLSRLSNYRQSAASTIAPIDIPALGSAVAAQKNPAHPINIMGADGLSLLGDKTGLEQVLLHLLQNAIDATKSKSDAVVMQWYAKDGKGYIEIVDQGVGMSADFMRSKLFKPFSSQKTGGFGIGAFEAKALVIAMGGMLEVESRENVGTRMIISLPLALTESEGGSDEALAGEAAANAHTSSSELSQDSPKDKSQDTSLERA